MVGQEDQVLLFGQTMIKSLILLVVIIVGMCKYLHLKMKDSLLSLINNFIIDKE